MRSVSAPSGPAAVLPVPNRLRDDVFLMVGARVLTLLLGVVTSVILARGLGASARGTLAVAFNMTLLLVQVGGLGMATASPYAVARDPASRGRVVVNALWAGAVLGVVLIGAGATLRAIAPSALEGVTWAQALVAFAAIPLTLAAVFLHSILLGESRMIAYNAIEAATGILAAGALAIVLLVFDGGVLAALAVLAGQQLVALIAYLVALRHHVAGRRRADVALLRRMVGYGFRAYAALLAGFLVVRMDMFLVNGFLGSGEAGRYAVTVALADGMILIPNAVAVNLFPRVARGSTTQTSAEIFRSVAFLYAVLCLITAPLASVGVSVLFGHAFAESAHLYLWLLPGIYAYGLLTIVAQHFAGRGFPLEAVLVWFAGLAVNLAMNLLLLNAYGTHIAALSSSVAYVLLLALYLRLFAREAGGYGVLRPRPGEALRMLRGSLQRAPA
jgi:O-antigen/teichoic acid export membrane protein